MEINIEEANKIIEKEIEQHNVVLFMKGSAQSPMCGFSGVIVQILNNMGIDFRDIDVLQDFNVREGIKQYSNWPTIPQLYVNKQFIGGCDIVRQMYEDGQLSALFEKEGILKAS